MGVQVKFDKAKTLSFRLLSKFSASASNVKVSVPVDPLGPEAPFALIPLLLVRDAHKFLSHQFLSPHPLQKTEITFRVRSQPCQGSVIVLVSLSMIPVIRSLDRKIEMIKCFRSGSWDIV